MNHDQLDDTDKARRALARAITRAIRFAQLDHPHPALLVHEAPSVLAILAGSSLLQLTRSHVLGDGEGDKMLAAMQRDMAAAADPSRNAPTGGEVPRSWGRRVRDAIKGKRHG